MSDNTSIQWTDASWVCITGCTRVSAGCDNCYSARMTYRLEKMGQEKYSGLTVLNKAGDRHFNGVVKCHDDALLLPLKWKKPRRIFVNSMSDTFHKDVPVEFINKMFAVMARCPQHTFQVLTKRPARMREYLNEIETSRVTKWGKYAGTSLPDIERSHGRVWQLAANNNPTYVLPAWPLPNCWLGISCENQEQYDNRIEHLKHSPAAIRFLSLEPLLGPIKLRDSDRVDIQWAIVGGESGPGARPCNIKWVRDIAKQCKAAGIACFIKQLGANVDDGVPFQTLENTFEDSKGGDIDEFPADLRVREFPKLEHVAR